MTKVFIDPRCNIEYSAFYIEGLYEVFGKKNVSFNSQYFFNLENADNLNIVLNINKQPVRYTIDYNDSPYINQAAYDWCSHYGKINFRKSFASDESSQKIINIPPGFGIRIWSPLETAFMAAQNVYQTKDRPNSLRKFLSSYIKQLRHLPLKSYQPSYSLPNYIFSVNTLWFSNEWIDTDKTVNQMRLNFYEAVSVLDFINAEVGFVYSQNKNENSIFKKYIKDKWISKENYLQKTQQSLIVFNTPAWDLCHGWKIAEYLALGKAIISTPFHNEMPFPLEHGKNIHFVSGSIDSIQKAVRQISADDTYRSSLEKQSRLYYDQYVQPKAVIEYLLEKARLADARETSA